MCPYFDEAGLLSDVLPIGDGCENRALWLCEAFFLAEMLRESGKTAPPDVLEIVNTYLTKEAVTKALMRLYDGSKWHPQADHTKLMEEGFSLDNYRGITSFGLYTGNELIASAGHKAFWDFRHTWQPQDKIYYAYAAGVWWGRALYELCALNMKISCFIMDRCPSGALDTDGKLLSFVRVRGAMKNDKRAIGTWNCIETILKERVPGYLNLNQAEIPVWALDPVDQKAVNPKANRWRLLFSMYFKDQENPINKICAVLWPI